MDSFCDEQVDGMGAEILGQISNIFEAFGQILPSTIADALRSVVVGE